MREIVSAPPQKAPLPALRPAVRDHGAAPGVEPKVPFDFGALAVQDPVAPARAPEHPAAPPVQTAAPPEVKSKAAAPPEVKSKAAAPPMRPPPLPGARVQPAEPARPAAPTASPSAAAAAPRMQEPQPAAPAFRFAPEHPLAPAGGGLSPEQHAAHRREPEQVAGPPRRELAKAAPTSAAPWLRIFHGLRLFADALYARVLASRDDPSPARAATPAHHASARRGEPPAIEWRGRVEGLAVAAVEIRRWSAEAGDAAAAARSRPDAAAAAPFGPEAARVGQGARIVGAELAVARAARAVRRLGDSQKVRAFGERMLLRWAAFDGLLARVRAGEGGAGPAVDSGTSAASGEAQAFFSTSPAGPGALEDAGAAPLFAAAGTAGAALDEAARRLAASAAGDAAAVPVEAMLATAAAQADSAAAEASFAAAPAIPERAGDEERRSREARVPPEKRERPATWELRIAATSTEVGVEDVARTLGLARIADVRDVLAEGLSTRHQFVLWTRVGTRLTAALQALVDAGLVETRIQPR